MIPSLLTALIIFSINITAECKKGMRNDPVLIVRADKTHYVYFLPEEAKVCEKYRDMFLKQQVSKACGCKILKHDSMKDRLRLRCVHWYNGIVLSSTIGVFYYYPETIDSCNAMRNELMFKSRY